MLHFSHLKRQQRLERAIRKHLQGYPLHQVLYVLEAFRHPEQAPEPIQPVKHAPWTAHEQKVVDSWVGSVAELARFLKRPRMTIYRHRRM